MQTADIQTKAINTYNENLLYFQAFEPDLYKKIHALEHAIEQDYYQEKYSLEYKDGYFDVLDLQNNTFLYGSSSIEHAKLAAKSIDYKKNGNLFETFYNVYIKDEDLDSYEEASIPATPYSAAAKIINYANHFSQDIQSEMVRIYKFIFFGTGLGLHLTSIHERIKSHVYFIVENDLELFRLSLFVTNYKELTNNGAKLFFSIFEEEYEFRVSVEKFLHEMFIYNQYLKFFHLLSHDESTIKEFQKIILGQTYLTFNYSALTNSLLRSLDHIKDNYNILNISQKLNNEYLNTKPLLILGAGPSLHNNIEWLKKNQHRFIIVGVTAMLSLLEEHNIKPAIITNVHGFNDALPHLEKIKDMSFFDETIAMFSTFTTPEFLRYFKKENIFLFQGTSTFKRGFDGLASSNIGALTYGLMLKLGAQNIYLLGLDFALDQETGATHSSSHQYVKELNKEKTEYDVEDEISYTKSVIHTKGNFQEKVITNILFNGFKDQCNLFTKHFKENGVDVYNLSDGAYIDDTIPTKIETILVDKLQELDHNKIFHSLYQTYKAHSQNKLNDEDINSIKAKLTYINKIDTILTEYSKNKYSTMDKFHYHLLGTFIDILGEEFDEDAEDMNSVISMYLQYVSGFIFDIINTKGLKNEKHHIKVLNKIVISQLKKIVSYYKKYLSDYLKEIEKKS